MNTISGNRGASDSQSHLPWHKGRGIKCLDSRAFGGLYEGGFPPAFWQSERLLGVFSTGTENSELSGFSGINQDTGKEKGDRTGLICPRGLDPPLYRVVSYEGK